MADNDIIEQDINRRWGAPAQAAPGAAPAGTPPLSYTVTPTLGPGAVATQNAEAGTVPDLYKQHLGLYSGNQQAIQNLRNAAEIATRITTGVSIPAQTELGRWATALGMKPEQLGMEKPEYVQEAKKAALMAMYATFQGKNPGLVADLESRHGVIPDPELEPGAFKALIAQGLSTMNYQNDWYKHMEDYKKDKGKGSILGYDPTAFPSQANTAVYLKDAYSSLPRIKGEKEPWIIGQPSSSTSPVPPTSTPSANAISALKANPQRKDEFEAKFGPGSAAQYLK